MRNGSKWVLLAALAMAPAVQAGENMMLVLDASGSMWGQIDGKPKIRIAREAVTGLLQNWRGEDQLGLVAYGHRRKGDCADIEALLPVAPVDAAVFKAKVDALNPKGMTPLSAAVQQAAEALRSSERKATVILISDGEETCDLDPCAVGAALEKSGADFTAHVIGFDVPNPQHQEQLKCLARNTGGRYFSAGDGASLRAALAEASVAAREPKLPAVPASLKGPAVAAVASRIEVAWEGPAGAEDYITIVQPADEPLAYLGYDDKLQKGKPARFDVPAQAGSYELRYVSPKREKPVLATAKIEVQPAQATVEIAAEVVASDIIRFRAQGPVGDGHWIGFAPAGSPAGEYSEYVYPDASGTTAGEMNSPQTPGDYEFRYVLSGSEAVVAARPVKVVPARPAILQPPSEVKVNQPLVLEFEGPRANRNWIGFVLRGGDSGQYATYAYANPQRRVEFNAPEEPGEFDLVFVIGGEQGEQIAARYPVRVVP